MNMFILHSDIPSQNSGCYSNSFDISDSRRTTKETDISREWWLQSWFALFAFNGFNKRSFFTTNVSTSTTMNINIEIITRSTSILANKTSFICFIDSFLKMRCFLIEFTTDVDISYIVMVSQLAFISSFILHSYQHWPSWQHQQVSILQSAYVDHHA